jgi:hypothetical protein
VKEAVLAAGPGSSALPCPPVVVRRCHCGDHRAPSERQFLGGGDE